MLALIAAVVLAALAPSRTPSNLAFLKPWAARWDGYLFAKPLPSDQTTGLLAFGLLPPRSKERPSQA